MPERWDVTSEIRYLKGFGFFLQSQNNSPPATIRDPFGLKKKKVKGRCDGCFCVLEDRLVEAILRMSRRQTKAESDLELRAQSCCGSIRGVPL